MDTDVALGETSPIQLYLHPSHDERHQAGQERMITYFSTLGYLEME
jgi:hypothetical protein